MSIETKLEALIAEQIELKNIFREKATELFKEVTKEFFDKNPGITAIKWSQYTPYFADGDPCVFAVNEPTFTNAPIESLDAVSCWGEFDGEEESSEIWAIQGNLEYILNGDTHWYEGVRESIKKAGGVDIESCKFLNKMFSSSEMESVMLDMFGDHVEVTATRDGFEVDEYDHD